MSRSIEAMVLIVVVGQVNCLGRLLSHTHIQKSLRLGTVCLHSNADSYAKPIAQEGLCYVFESR